MAVSLVGSIGSIDGGTTDGSGFAQFTATAAVPAGDLMVLSAAYVVGSATAITDVRGNVWRLATAGTTAGQGQQIWVMQPVDSAHALLLGDRITIDTGGHTFDPISVTADRYTGVSPGSAGASGYRAGTNTAVSPSISLAVTAGDLVVGMIAIRPGATGFLGDSPSPWLRASSTTSQLVDYLAVTSVGTAVFTPTGPGGAVSALAVAFQCEWQ